MIHVILAMKGCDLQWFQLLLDPMKMSAEQYQDLRGSVNGRGFKKIFEKKATLPNLVKKDGCNEIKQFGGFLNFKKSSNHFFETN